MLGTSTRTRGSTIDDDACSSVSESIGASERPARRKNKRGGAKRKGRASSGEAALADAPARGVSNRDGGRAPGAASNGTDMGLRIAGRAALASSQHSSAGSMQPPSAPNSMRRAPTAPVREPAPHRDGSRLRAASPPRGPRAEQTSRARPSQVREAPPHDSRARPPAMRGSRHCRRRRSARQQQTNEAAAGSALLPRHPPPESSPSSSSCARSTLHCSLIHRRIAALITSLCTLTYSRCKHYPSLCCWLYAIAISESGCSASLWVLARS
jgi:hypothetical protein